MPAQRKYPEELRERAVKMVLEIRAREGKGHLVGFIDSRRGRFGVEPVCAVLEFPVSTYYAAKKREPSAREVRDEQLKEQIMGVWEIAVRAAGHAATVTRPQRTDLPRWQAA